MSTVQIELAQLQDWPSIEQIYREGIRTGNATFQTEAEIPEAAAWFAGKVSGQVFVARTARTICGWAALSPVSPRRVYAGVTEVSVYVAYADQGRGVGRALLEHLIRSSEAVGIWTLQAGIFPENQASIHLHQRVGFRIVGVREKLGQLQGCWRDVVLLERRSPQVV